MYILIYINKNDIIITIKTNNLKIYLLCIKIHYQHH